LIHVATLVLYIGALILWIRALVAGGDIERETAVAGWVAAAGVGVHFLALLSFSLHFDQLPLTGLAPSLSTLSFLTGVGLLFTLALGEASRIGILIIPLVVILESTALVLGIRPATGTLDFQGAWFALHVSLALASIGAVALAAAAGTLYLLQFRELKARRLGKAVRFFPPLATLDRVGRVGVLAGFIMLTLSLLLGWAWTVNFRNSLQVGDPKTVWGIFIWAAISCALVLRQGEDPERRGAVGALVAFGLIVASYLVIRLVIDGGLFL